MIFLFFIVTGVAISFYLFAFFLVFFTTGQVIVLSPIEAVDIVRDPTYFGEFSTVISVVLCLIFLYKYIKSEFIRYYHFREQRVYSVTLSELAQIWGAGKIDITTKETVPVLYLKSFQQDRTKDFITRYMEKNMRFFPTEKLEIIFELFKILENEATNVSSVAALYRHDPEKTGNYQAIITADGRTAYDIFKETTLYEHTMNVAEKAIEFLKDKDPISFETSMCDGIIVALAHDIGKLKQIRQFRKEYPNEILTQNPHQAVSKMFFSETWPGYTSIEDAIYNHHSAPNASAPLTRMIIWADKEARKAEMLTWQTKRLEEKKTEEKKDETVHQKIEDESSADNAAISISEKPVKKRRRKESESESESEKEIKNSIILPIEQNPIKVYDQSVPIEFTDELEAKIIGDLRVAINSHTFEKPQGIFSISFSENILFSITYFNSIVKKHIYGETLIDPNEVKRVGMYISAKFSEKGYTSYLKKEVGCSTFFLNFDNGKSYKYICIPFSADVFNMTAYELDNLKDSFLKSITVSEFRLNDKEL